MCRLQPKPVPCNSNYYRAPTSLGPHTAQVRHPSTQGSRAGLITRAAAASTVVRALTSRGRHNQAPLPVIGACLSPVGFFFSEQAPRLSPREAHLRTCTCSPPGVAATNARLWILRQLALQFHRRCPCCCQEYLPCLRFHIPKPSCSQPLSQLLALHPLHPPPSPCQLKCS